MMSFCKRYIKSLIKDLMANIKPIWIKWKTFCKFKSCLLYWWFELFSLVVLWKVMKIQYLTCWGWFFKVPPFSKISFDMDWWANANLSRIFIYFCLTWREQTTNISSGASVIGTTWHLPSQVSSQCRPPTACAVSCNPSELPLDWCTTASDTESNNHKCK